ncbi:SPEF1-like protein [Giardia muris]|uniref:SPEF1-like protein n=1 Tax=Giardia muris TaxID=5742 RepID=A0A4Z1SSH9_GIAMU|nr:SPEF1-like protein [Giardia muris]|eukprot:TNJ28730.1 SPEF1-like protein [Giardia muris]
MARVSHVVLTDDMKLEVYDWVDQVQLSRPRKLIGRDFSDGVLMAETIHYFLPKLVDLNNYQQVFSVEGKKDNWKTLQLKVLGKLHITLTSDEIEALATAKNGAIERLLYRVREEIKRLVDRSGSAKQSRRTSIPNERSGTPPQRTTLQRRRPPMPESPEQLSIPAPQQPLQVPSPPMAPLSQPSQSYSLDDRSISLISDLREENALLKEKLKKLEQLVRIKDEKITTLSNKITFLTDQLRGK